MDDRRQYQQPATMEDECIREPLPLAHRSPRPTRTRMLLSILAALLVVTVVGLVVIRDLGAQASPPASTTLSVRAATTVQRSTPTPTLAPLLEPKENGWTQVTGAAGDVKFSASSPRRGYLCGRDQSGRITFGVTSDGGRTWVFEKSPAAFESCSIQISPTNAFDLVVNSEAGPYGDPCPNLDAHYSTNGGKTWKAAPTPKIPSGKAAPSGLVHICTYGPVRLTLPRNTASSR